MIPLPALPAPAGPSSAKARFFSEAAVAFELMALWHSLPIKEQVTLHAALQAAVAAAAAEELRNPQPRKDPAR